MSCISLSVRFPKIKITRKGESFWDILKVFNYVKNKLPIFSLFKRFLLKMVSMFKEDHATGLKWNI